MKPYLLYKTIGIVEKIEDIQDSKELLYNQFILIVVEFLQKIFDSFYNHHSCVLRREIQTSLHCSIFNKLLGKKKNEKIIKYEKSDEEKEKKYVKEKSDEDEIEIINLIEDDLNNILSFIPFQALQLPINILNVIVSYIYTFYFFGFYTTLISLIFLIGFYFPLIFFLEKAKSKTDKKVRKIKDKRVSLMREIIKNIRMIKSSFSEFIFEKKMKKIRKSEINLKKKESQLDCIEEFLWSNSDVLNTTLIFIMSRLFTGKNINNSIVFTTSILHKISYEIFSLFWSYSNFKKMKVSLKRVEKYFNYQKDEHISNFNKISNSSSCLVDMKNCFFSPYCVQKDNFKDPKFILENINIKINKGDFIIILGKIGSGKSSFLRSILGELNLIKGTIKTNIKNGVSFCSQDHFIMDGTIQQNILFGKEYNEKKYLRILKRCFLEKDLKSLEKGDLTKVGEQGVKLSGGQKARISIARACYHSESDLFFFDSTLKDLDINVTNNVFKEIFLKELKNMTKIFVTHNPLFIQYASKIIFFENGKIKYIFNTYEEFLKSSIKNEFKDDSLNEKIKTPIYDEKKEEINFLKEEQKIKLKEEKKKKEEKEEEEEEEEDININRWKNQFINFKIIKEYIKFNPKLFLEFFIFVLVFSIIGSFKDVLLCLWNRETNTSKESKIYFLLYI